MRSRNHWCHRKAINITYYECVFVAFSNQHAIRMRHIIINDLPQFYGIFVLYLFNGTIFEKKIIQHEMFFVILYTTFIWNISHAKKKWVRYDQKCVLVFM